MSRRVTVRGSGGPEVLHLVEGEIPTPRAGRVCVRVHVAGVAFGDVMRRRGVLAPPGEFTPGYDVVGVVHSHGPGLDDGVMQDFPVGRRVAVFMPGPGLGGYADHVCVKAKHLIAVPDGVGDITAVALGLNYITAHQLLTRTAALAAGQRVLVHGAAGGLGTAALDLGMRMGLELVGTASPAKHPILAARGCQAIDYRSEDFVQVLEGRPVDAVLDPIGGEHLVRSLSVLGPKGTLVSLGISGDLDRGLLGAASGLMRYFGLKLRSGSRRLRMYNITVSPGASRAECRADWASLMALGAEGVIEPTIGAVLPLDEAREAHALVDRSGVVGKIVLRCVDEDALH